MPVIIRTNRSGVPSYATGSNGDAVNWSENQADALVFVDGAAATAFSTGKNIHGATQVTVSGKTNPGRKTCDG
jgi:hypothetical protein